MSLTTTNHSLTQLVSNLTGVFQPTSQNDIVTGREHEIMLISQFFLSALTSQYTYTFDEILRTNTSEALRKNRIVRQECLRFSQAPNQFANLAPEQFRLDPISPPPHIFSQQPQQFYPHGQAMYLMGTPGIGKTLLTKFVASQLGLDDSIDGLDQLNTKQQYIFLNANYTINHGGEIMSEISKKIRDFDKNVGQMQKIETRKTSPLRQLCCNPKFFNLSRVHNKVRVPYQYCLYQDQHHPGYEPPNVDQDDEDGDRKNNENNENNEQQKPLKYLLSPLPLQENPIKVSSDGSSRTTLTQSGEQIDVDSIIISNRERLLKKLKLNKTPQNSSQNPNHYAKMDSDSEDEKVEFGKFINTQGALIFEHVLNNVNPIDEQGELLDIILHSRYKMRIKNGQNGGLDVICDSNDNYDEDDDYLDSGNSNNGDEFDTPALQSSSDGEYLEDKPHGEANSDSDLHFNKFSKKICKVVDLLDQMDEFEKYEEFIPPQFFPKPQVVPNNNRKDHNNGVISYPYSYRMTTDVESYTQVLNLSDGDDADVKCVDINHDKWVKAVEKSEARSEARSEDKNQKVENKSNKQNSETIKSPPKTRSTRSNKTTQILKEDPPKPIRTRGGAIKPSEDEKNDDKIDKIVPKKPDDKKNEKKPATKSDKTTTDPNPPKNTRNSTPKLPITQSSSPEESGNDKPMPSAPRRTTRRITHRTPLPPPSTLPNLAQKSTKKSQTRSKKWHDDDSNCEVVYQKYRQTATNRNKILQGPTIESTTPRHNPFVSVNENDLKRFHSYETEFLPQLPLSAHFGTRFSHNSSVIVVIDEFDQLPPSHAAELIRTCYAPFSRLFVIGLGNKLNFLEQVMNNATSTSNSLSSQLTNTTTPKKGAILPSNRNIEGDNCAGEVKAIDNPLPTQQNQVQFTFNGRDMSKYTVDLRPSIIPFKQYDFKGFSQVLTQRNLLALKRILDWAILYYHNVVYLPYHSKNNKKRLLSEDVGGRSDDLYVDGKKQKVGQNVDENHNILNIGPNPIASVNDINSLRFSLQSRPAMRSGLSSLYSSQQNSNYGEKNNSLVQLPPSHSDSRNSRNSRNSHNSQHQSTSDGYIDLTKYTWLALGESFDVDGEMRNVVQNYMNILKKLNTFLAKPEAITYCARSVVTLSSDVRSCLEIWKEKLDLIGFFHIPGSVLGNKNVPTSPSKRQNLPISPRKSTNKDESDPISKPAPISPLKTPNSDSNSNLLSSELGFLKDTSTGGLSMKSFMTEQGLNVSDNGGVKPPVMKFSGISGLFGSKFAQDHRDGQSDLNFNNFNHNFSLSTSTVEKSQLSQQLQTPQSQTQQNSQYHTQPNGFKHPRYPIIDFISFIYSELGLSQQAISETLRGFIPPTLKSHPELTPTELTEPLASLKPTSILQGKSVETLLIEKTNEKLGKLTPIQLRVLIALILTTLGLGAQASISLVQFTQLVDVALDKVGLPSIMSKTETLQLVLSALEIQHLVGITYSNLSKKRVASSAPGKAQVFKYTQTYSIKSLLDPLQFASFLKTKAQKEGTGVFDKAIKKIEKIAPQKVGI